MEANQEVRYLVGSAESTYGTGTLAAHIYVPRENKPYETNNRSLCGKFSVNVEGDDYASPWVDLLNEPTFYPDLSLAGCKTCAKIAAKRFQP